MSSRKCVECIAIVSAKNSILDSNQIEKLERQQEQYIRKFAKANKVKVVAVFRGNGQGQYVINKKFYEAVDLIRRGKVNGIITINMKMISLDLEDAYCKVGKVRSAGGEMITVDEGFLKLSIWRNKRNER